MFKRKDMRWLWALMTLVIALPAFGADVSHADTGTRLFPETGKTVKGRFLDYWQSHGGRNQQGYPISNELQERSMTDGKAYTVQYFERAVFEYHPENKAPNDVLLSLLGVFLYTQKYKGGVTGQQPNTTPGSTLFSQTGHRVGGKFLDYWNNHGGLAQQGYPISDEFMERSDLNGKTYRVQYFERAVFELHPENAGTPYEVLLSQLGKFRYNANYGADTNTGSTGSTGSTDKSTKSVTELVTYARTDINAYWQKVFQSSGVTYTPPRQITGYTKPISTGCGTAVLNNAFYCPPDHSIYYDTNFLQSEAKSFGDFAPVVIMAHEWGHLVQRELGLLSDSYFSVEIELQADCFAGVWSAHASDSGALAEGNLDEGAAALFSAGNNNVPWFDPRAHGTPDDRVNSFVDGFTGGVGACIK
jgi:predicted metalloprotease